MSVADELRAFVAEVVPGAPVHPSAEIRDLCTRAADRLDQLEAVRDTARRLMIGPRSAIAAAELGHALTACEEPGVDG